MQLLCDLEQNLTSLSSGLSSEQNQLRVGITALPLLRLERLAGLIGMEQIGVDPHLWPLLSHIPSPMLPLQYPREGSGEPNLLPL